MGSQVYFHHRCVFSLDLKEIFEFISFNFFILKIKKSKVLRKCIAQVCELCAEVKLLLISYITTVLMHLQRVEIMTLITSHIASTFPTVIFKNLIKR